MSHTIEFKGPKIELTVVTEEAEQANSNEMLVIVATVQKWNMMTPLSEISCIRDAIEPMEYAYLVELATTEVCDETWMFAGIDDSNPMVTIALPDAWTESMIAMGSDLRRYLFALRTRVGLISFNVVFP